MWWQFLAVLAGITYGGYFGKLPSLLGGGHILDRDLVLAVINSHNCALSAGLNFSSFLC